MKDNNFIRDYLNIFILEKIQKTDEIISSFQQRLQTTNLQIFNDDERKTKEAVDNAILKLIGRETNQSLSLPETRVRLIDQTYEGLNNVLKQNFNKIISQSVQEKTKHAPNVQSQKLILSEIFLHDDENPLIQEHSKRNPGENRQYNDALASVIVTLPKEEKYNITDFEKDITKLDFADLNCKKAFLFFDILCKYNFKVKFPSDKLQFFEGHLLRIIYSDEANFNYFIFKKSFLLFMKNFVEQFQIDFEARLKEENLMSSNNLVLLASYSPALCQHLDKFDYVESFLQRLPTLSQSEHHLYLKIFINFFKNKSPMVQKLVNLKAFEQFLEQILKSDSESNVALFSILMSKASRDHLNTKQFISKNLLKQLLEKINKNFALYENLKIIAVKHKNKPSEFKVNNSNDPVLLLDHYCKTYFDLIKQKLSIKQFKQLYYTSLGFLKFLSKFNAKLDEEQKLGYCTIILDLFSVFYYQNNIVNSSIVSLRKFLSPMTIDYLLEEFFETNLINNSFTIFERNDFSRKTIQILSNFQTLLLSLIETCQVNAKILKVRQIKKLLDRIYRIRQLIGSFYYNIKVKYLSKGLLKYVNKLKKSLMKDVIYPLDEILSQNALILQKLSHTQVLDENMLFYANKSAALGFERQSETSKISQLIDNGNQLLYIVSKVDRKDGYLEDIITFNLFLLEKVESFISEAETNKQSFDFDFIERIIECLIINIYFVKTYDENHKKATSIKVLKRAVELFVRILHFAKNFVNLQSNYQIYILLENLGLFWLLFFDFNYRFYDRLSFVFIDNLKTLSRQKNDNKNESFSAETLYKILVFLNEFVDLKSKNSLLNFIIIKQLDTICITLTNISNLNQNFIVNIFQKVFNSNYGSEIHKLQQKYFLSLSAKVLSIQGIKEAFLEFVCKNMLYLNKYVSSILRNLLDRNFEIEQLKKLSLQEKNLFNYAVLEANLDPSAETTQFLLGLIQMNIRNKTLFEDLIMILRTHLKSTTSSQNSEIIRKLFLSESIFWKLVRLYKKDQVNLSKILKYLLLICKHFNFLNEINIPPSVVKSILNNKEINKFNDVYMLLLVYIFKNSLFEEFQEDINNFFTHTKNSLDDLLFFSKQINLDSNLRMIYYSLKVLKNCSAFVKGIPAISSLDTDDFIVRYVLQMMDDYNRLEIVPVNNLFHHFKKRENIIANFKTSIYESKIVNLVFEILDKNRNLFGSQIEDFFVVNKLISFSYVVINQKTYDHLIPMVSTLLQRGIQASEKDVFKDIYYDFYLLLNYDFGYADPPIGKLVKDYLYGNKKSIVVSLTKLLDELNRKNIRYDTMGFNSIIRNLLKIFYIVNECEKDLYVENYRAILGALDYQLENNYKDINSLTKLEKLFVNIYLLVYNKTQLDSINSSRVFLWLFNTHVEFKVSSLVDKYIYMGLFNSYLKHPNSAKRLSLDKNTGELHYLANEANQSAKTQIKQKLSYDTKKVTEALEQLRFKGLPFENEIIMMKFIINLFKIDRDKFFKVGIKKEIISEKIETVKNQLISIFGQSYSEVLLFKYRLQFILLFLKKNIQAPENQDNSILNELIEFLPLFETQFGHSEFPAEVSKPQNMKITQLELKLIKNLYKLTVIKNEAFMKPRLLQTLFAIWNKTLEFPSKEKQSKILLQKSILRMTIRIMKNRYDEMRFVLYRNYIPTIFEMFSSFEASNPLKPISSDTANPAPDIKNVEINDEDDPNKEPNKQETLEFRHYSDSDYLMLQEPSEDSLMEDALYLFYLVSKNHLLMSMEYKLKILDTIKERKEKLLVSKFCQIVYEFSEKEYTSEQSKVLAEIKKSPNSDQNQNGGVQISQTEMTELKAKMVSNQETLAKDKDLKDDKKWIATQKEETPLVSEKSNMQEELVYEKRKPMAELLPLENASTRLKVSSLSYKQKNILYVHKVLAALNTSVEKHNRLSEKEEQYLTFGLISLQKHLLENLDPELFNAFGFFGLISSFVIDDRISVNFKRDCLQILQLFLKTCKNKNNVQSAEVHTLMTFYERLLFDNYPEIVQIYFEVLDLIFQYVSFSDEFINDYMDKMSYCLFEAYKSIAETVFISALFVFVQVLQNLKPKIDGQRISNTVYLFLKINNKEMKLYERTLFICMLAYFEEHNILDAVRFTNATFFVRYSHSMEGLKKIPQSLNSLVQLTETHPGFQKLLKLVNFEALYKVVFKHHVDDIPFLKMATKLFLRYTYKIEENKFEMFDCIRQILKHIRFFYRKGYDSENKEMVILLYKALVNASLFKENSDYLVKSELTKVVTECHYIENNECSIVIISLLFNICYIFEKDEIQIKRLITEPINRVLSAIFEESLETKNDITICELIDLFVGFIQHQFVDFFNLEMIRKIKLTLNLYYNSMEITLKFLNIMRDITVSGTDAVKELIFSEFDYIYLYHIHYRNLKNTKINTLTKHIIYNLLKFREPKAKEQELITYGIPENIIHTFSLEDSENVMMLNLKIIIFSLKFEKCTYFIKNNFLAIIRLIFFASPNRYKDEIIFSSLDVLHGLLHFFKDPQLLNAYYYFDDIQKIFDLISLCLDNDKYFLVLLKILKNVIDNDKDKIGSITKSNKAFLNEVINLRPKNKNRDLMNLLYNICNYVDIHESIMETKMNLNRNHSLSIDDRTILENGQSILIYFRDNLHKNSLIKFNFTKNKFKILNIELSEQSKKSEKKTFSFATTRIESIDKASEQIDQKIESYFRTYFMKNLKKELYFSLTITLEEKLGSDTEFLFLIYENEYKCQKWKNLFEVLKNK